MGVYIQVCTICHGMGVYVLVCPSMCHMWYMSDMSGPWKNRTYGDISAYISAPFVLKCPFCRDTPNMGYYMGIYHPASVRFMPIYGDMPVRLVRFAGYMGIYGHKRLSVLSAFVLFVENRPINYPHKTDILGHMGINPDEFWVEISA